MPRYFLRRLKVEGFRGVNNQGNPLDISFKPDAVNSVFAVNGVGKARYLSRYTTQFTERSPNLMISKLKSVRKTITATAFTPATRP